MNGQKPSVARANQFSRNIFEYNIEEYKPAVQLTFFRNISARSSWTHLGALKGNVESQGYHCKALVAASPKEVNPVWPQFDTFPCVTRLRQPTTAMCTPKLHSQSTLVRITKRALCCYSCCRTQNVKGRLLKDSTSRCWEKTKEDDGLNFPRSSEMRLLRSFHWYEEPLEVGSWGISISFGLEVSKSVVSFQLNYKEEMSTRVNPAG